MKRHDIARIRRAFEIQHARALGQDPGEAYMRVPADEDRDPDLILSDAIDELEILRSVTDPEPAPPKRRVFYDCSETQEHLRHRTVDAAVEHLVELLDGTPTIGVADQGGTEGGLALMVKVYAWRSLEPHLDAGGVLDQVLERLDEEHGDPDGEWCSGATPAMRAAAEAFVRAVLSEYENWACERAPELDVDVNLPEWLAAHPSPPAEPPRDLTEPVELRHDGPHPEPSR